MRDDFKQKQLEYFDSRTPEDPAYWSTEIFDIYDNHYDHVISKRGQEELKRLETMEWQDVLREYVRWWIKGMSMLHVVNVYFNVGNGSPYQYGWYPHGFKEVALRKIINKFASGIVLDKPGEDKLELGYDYIRVSRDLGYGKEVERHVGIDIDFGLSRAGGKIKPTFKGRAKCSGQPGFYDGFSQLAKGIQAELDPFRKDPLFKTDLSEYDTYPDVSRYKDKHDQLGVISFHATWDVIGTGRNRKFNPKYIAAYKEAREYCPGLPLVEYNDDLKTCVYNEKTFTADEVDDICCKRVPDSLHYITQGVRAVLVNKYGLLPTILEAAFSPEDPIRSHIHWIRDNYGMTIDKDLQGLIDKYRVDTTPSKVYD